MIHGKGAPAIAIEGVILRSGQSSVRLRVFGEEAPVTLRAPWRADLVPGVIATIEIAKRWRYARNEYATGRVLGVTLDIRHLNLVPLAVHVHGQWRPQVATPGEPFGVSPGVFNFLPAAALPDAEMEQVIPGADLDDPDTDPAICAADLANVGDLDTAFHILGRAVAQDLRYLDGHAHLGHMVLRLPRGGDTLARARLHYTVGAEIGRSFLSPNFTGYLRSVCVDNRPLLRCLHGLALCQGVAGDHKDAEKTLWELLRFDPEDRLGAEELLACLRRGDTRGWAFGDEAAY